MSPLLRHSLPLSALTLVLAQAVSGQSPSTPPNPRQHAVPPPAAAAQEQFVVYWTTEPGWSTELHLRNNLESGELTVTPALRTSAGVETALPSVTLKPGEVVSLDLHDTLMNAAPQLVGAWGSLVLRYRTTVHRALYVAVMVRGDGRPIAFHLDGYGRGSKYEAGSREGIWWLPWKSVTDYLILTNSGDQVLAPNLVLYDSSGKAWQQQVSLSARETRRLSIRSLLQQAGLSGSFGGIKIDIAKGARYLDSAHLLFDQSGGFSAIMKMFKHDPSATVLSRSFGGVKEWTTRAPMLALSDPDPALGFPAGTKLQPKVYIRNTSGNAFTSHLRFNWRSATTTGKSAPLNLAFKANETQVIDVAALQAQNLLPADAHWATVILSASVLPDELLAIAASYNQTGRYGTQTPFSDQLASHWEAGKWEVDGTHNSLVTIANGGNKAALAQLTILYNQGSGQYQVEQMLAPDEQMGLDFGKLIHDQVPDKNGQTLPRDLASGTYRLLDLTDAPLGNLYEGKVIVDKTYGHAAYNCMVCCGPDSPWMVFDPLSVGVNGFVNQVVQARNSCSGRIVTITADFPTWWTDNTSVATASGSQINGIAPGTTAHNAQSVLMYWGLREDSGGSDCPVSQEQPSASTNVIPSVSFSAISNVIVGQTAATTATVNPTNNSTPISLSVSSPVSLVSPTGTFTTNTNVVVRGVTAGTATLTATVTSPEGGSPIQVGSTSFPVADFNLSGAQTIMDGQQGSFSASVTGGAASGYQWSFTAPTGAGNNPNVQFTAATSAQTNTDGHWFALPDVACPTSSNIPAYYNAAYTINAGVTFAGGGTLNKSTTLTVNSLWNPAGFTNPNISDITGLPDLALNATTNKWVVTGMGNLGRLVPTSATINVIPTSQFYNKTQQHEQVHVNNWIQGPGHLYGDLFIPSDFFNQIKDFTGSSQSDLTAKIIQAKNTYFNSQKVFIDARHNQDEHQAYLVSDPIAPQYVYQNCGKF